MSSYQHFTDEQKERANSVDLVDFLQRQGEKLIPSGREKRLASDHSITVRGNRWYDHAAEQGSYAIDLVKRLYNLSFPDAVTLLLGGGQGQPYRKHSKSEPEQRKPFVLPQAHTDMRRVFAYLIKQRCISREVLSVSRQNFWQKVATKMAKTRGCFLNYFTNSPAGSAGEFCIIA